MKINFRNAFLKPESLLRVRFLFLELRNYRIFWIKPFSTVAVCNNRIVLFTHCLENILNRKNILNRAFSHFRRTEDKQFPQERAK